MSGIHDLVLNKVQEALDTALRVDVPTDDPSRAGLVAINSLGETDPDEARISLTIHENDPDQIVTGAPTALDRGRWTDEIIEVECGFAVTWKRTFTVKARCMLDRTGEDDIEAREIASIVRERIEDTLLHIDWSEVRTSDGEYVSRGCISTDIRGEQRQGGGPPDSFDYLLKVQFAIWSTRVG